ncbi:hypothetical protein GCM10009847_04520 [Leucobacter tardus]|uniref:Beta-lactamase family protein n=1 Tax=Leucobacter tardus TaxID=501483 RepID=A0A939QJ47_9MICO|nr:serine hydrolase domain-containing protein [Leucobacter tardus]MBO2988659.1 beta-lactamase family protein [Leucobacter tardus]
MTITLTLIAAGGATAHATAPARDAHPLVREDVDAWLDGFLPPLLEREGIVGATVAVVGNGEVVTERGFGTTDEVEGAAVDPHQSLFRIGSISKLVTATAVMQLVERDLLDLDVPVQQYLDFELDTQFAEPVTLRHLLTHTAGFEDKVAGVIGDPDTAAPTLRDAVTIDPPEQIFRPGTTPAYSNYSNGLAAYVVEHVMEEPYADYVQREIFDPAGMRHATLEQPLPSDAQATLSKGYDHAGGAEIPFEMNSPAPAGAISATASDMSAFMLAQLPDRTTLLGPSALEQLHQPALTADDLGGLALGPRMALGFFESDRNGHRVISHGGDLTAFHAQLDLYPEDRSGIFISLNSTGLRGDATTAIRDTLSQAFADRYFPDQRAGIGDVTNTAAQHADAITGSYQVARRGETTFMRLFFALSSVEIAQGSGETVTISALTDASGTPVEFIEVEPWVWQEVDGMRRVPVDQRDGEVRAVGLNPAFALQPMPESRAVLAGLAVAALVILAAALVTAPLPMLMRRWYRRPRPTAPGERILTRARLAALIALVGAGALWAVIASALLSDGPPVSGVLIRSAQILTLLAVLGIIPAALTVWVRGRQIGSSPGTRSWFGLGTSVVVASGFAALGYVAVVGGLLAPSITY